MCKCHPSPLQAKNAFLSFQFFSVTLHTLHSFLRYHCSGLGGFDSPRKFLPTLRWQHVVLSRTPGSRGVLLWWLRNLGVLLLPNALMLIDLYPWMAAPAGAPCQVRAWLKGIRGPRGSCLYKSEQHVADFITEQCNHLVVVSMELIQSNVSNIAWQIKLSKQSLKHQLGGRRVLCGVMGFLLAQSL